MTVKIVPGEISATDATVRRVIPTAVQPKWPPLELVAETLATPRRRFPAHRHSGAEVLTYVVEGSGLYSYGDHPEEPVAAGSVALLSAYTDVPHAVNPGRGQTLRWMSVVVGLGAGNNGTNGLQSTRVGAGASASDGTSTRFLVGPASPVRSAIGLEAYEIAFLQEGTSFRKVGHTTQAVGYALSGAGSVDGRAIELGEAAIVEETAGVGIQGEPGFRIVLIQVPRPTR